MDSRDNHGKEDDKDFKYEFYRKGQAGLTPDEMASLTPILQTLKNPESRYENPVLIAQGGEKTVFKVYDQHLNRYVAMAQPLRSETDQDQEQFLREGQLTANMTHPNIVPIHNMGIGDDGLPFFSMELVPGDSLRDIINKLKQGDPGYASHYPRDTLLGIFNKVCDAVAYAHSRRVLHLDIKPGNIRVGEFGEVFLCDWGLACVEGGLESGEVEPGELDSDILNDMTLSGTIKGSPGFMAPEQVTGESRTAQTDIYALGAILYHLLTYELPVDGNNANEIIENTREGNLIPLRKRKAGQAVPSGLAAVAMKALAKEPKARYVGVKELQSDLRRFLTGYPTVAEHAGIITRLALLVYRHRRLAFWSILFFILLSMVVSVNMVQVERQRRKAENNFKLFREQKIEADRLNLELLGVAESAAKGYDNLFAAEKLKMLDRMDMEVLAPSAVQRVLRRKAELHFTLQQFNAADQYFRQLDFDDEEFLMLKELASKYAKLKPNDFVPLSPRELAELIKIRGVPGRIIYPMYHQYKFMKHADSSPEAYLPLASILLGKVNQIGGHTIKPLKLEKREKGHYLDLSGTRYSIYTFPVFGNYAHHIFEPLQLYGLDISHTPVSLLKEVSILKLKELRMVGVVLEDQYNVAETFLRMGLERVTVGKGDYREQTLEGIRSRGIEVVEEEYEKAGHH